MAKGFANPVVSITDFTRPGGVVINASSLTDPERAQDLRDLSKKG